MTHPAKPKRHGHRWYRQWATWRRLSAAVFLTLLVLAQFEWFHWFRGTTSGTTLLGVIPFLDPLAAGEVMLTTHALTLTAILGVGILVLVAVILGPIFCGFVCPLGLVLDLNQWVRRVFRRLVLRKKRHLAVPKRVAPWLRFGFLGVVIGFALVSGLPLFQAVSPINLLVRAAAMGSLIGLSVIAGLVVLEWFVPRVWCRALCPLGACYAVLGRKAVWRVRINPQTAGQIRCKQCEIHCPMGIEIMRQYTLPGRESITHPSCIRCGECIDICPNTVLGLRFRPFPKPEQDAYTVHLPVVESAEGDLDASSCPACEHLVS
jgi:ferredoxin-type protein NapH